MTIFTSRLKQEQYYTPCLVVVQPRIGVTNTYERTSNYLSGKLQIITEPDKEEAARNWKTLGKYGIVINPVTIRRAVTQGDVINIVFDPDFTYPAYPRQGCSWTGSLASLQTLASKTDVVVGNFITPPSWMAPYSAQKAYAKMGSPEAVDLGQALGELSETIGFLRNPVKGLVKHAVKHQRAVSKKLKKRRTTRANWGMTHKAKATLTADVLAESNLAYQYGYLPLMNDIDGLTTLATQQKVAINRKIRSAGGVVEHEGDPVITTRSPKVMEGSSMVGYFDYKLQTKFKASSKLYYRYKPWMEDAIVLSKLGLSPTQWITTAWAVTPLSFVVDWGLDVSTWLRSLEPKPQLDVLNGCTSVTTSEYYQMTIREASIADRGWPARFQAVKPARGWVNVDTLSRFKIVPPSFTPVWTRQFSGFNKTLSAVSLAWALRPKILRRGLVYQDFGL